MTRAYRDFTDTERNKTNNITRVINEKSADILKEERVLDYLMTRSLGTLANNALEVMRGLDSEELDIFNIAGLLEANSDFLLWRFSGENPVDRFSDQIYRIISENIRYDRENDLVFIAEFADDSENARLGKALLNWVDENASPEWAAIGRSLILSSIAKGGDVGAAKNHRVLKPVDYFPRASRLTASGHWAFTASPAISASNLQGGDILNISVSFPVNASHFMLIRGVRPFVKLQLHGIDFRSAADFERWDSSGWVYYPTEQTLVLKMKHRETVENIRIYYRVEAAPAPPPVEEAASESNSGDNTVVY
jgi:hypothetical protein